MRLSLSQINEACGSSSCKDNDNIIVSGIATDNRKVKIGDLFVSIKGSNFDGHDFVPWAIKAGAEIILSERPLPDISGLPVVVVENTIKALGQLANYWRKQTKAQVIGITGSAGKTTVKEVLVSVLREKGKVACNALNLNNQIGLPYSMLSTDGDEDFWVMEVGISQAHDMTELGIIIQPDMAIIINAADAHAEGLGEKGVAYHKAALLNYVAQGGSAFICADFPDLLKETELLKEKGLKFDAINYFSAHDPSYAYTAKYLGTELSNSCSIKGKYTVCLNNECFDIETPFNAGYGAENSIAIAGAASKLGLDIAEIKRGFSKASLPEQRFQIKNAGKWQCINDTYNANPLSMKCMLEAAHELANNQTFICVLGMMGELGNQSAQKHMELGKLIPSFKVKHLFWVGDYAEDILLGLKSSDCAEYFDAENFHAIENIEDFLNKFKLAKLENGLIFFKGSRSNCLEKYYDAFIAHEEKLHVL